MLEKLVLYGAIIAAAYWYWSGPYQEGSLSGYDKQLEDNNEKMAMCIRGKNYNAGSTGNFSGLPEEVCAQEYNFYQKNGQWYSYDSVRKD
ncbi:MAG: hypothetical protein V7709_06615 [Halioglobus sp.]